MFFLVDFLASQGATTIKNIGSQNTSKGGHNLLGLMSSQKGLVIGSWPILIQKLAHGYISQYISHGPLLRLSY